MHRTTRSPRAFALSLVLGSAALGAPALAQDPPFRAALRSGFDRVGVTYADCWAEGDTAFMAYFGQNLVEFLDVSDPDNVVNFLTYAVPSPNNGISAQEVKSENGLLYIALAGAGPDSVQIVDVRNPATPTILTNIAIATHPSPHNMFIKDGWLFLAKGSSDGIAVIDLTSYDPDNPPAAITQKKWDIMGAGSVHDITVTGDRLWVSDFAGSQKVFDISNIDTQIPTLMGSIGGGTVHSNWPTADHAFLVTADESFGGPMRLFEIVDDGTTVELLQRDAWVNPLTGNGASGNAHNPLVDGDRVYFANNGGGVLCLQIDRNSKTFEKVASYDTSTIVPTAATGQGCWGIYPFRGASQILASDRQSGFFVLDFSALEIAFVADRPHTIAANQSVSVDVTIDELGDALLDAATVTLHASVEGGAYQPIAMTSIGGNAWRGVFPVVQCGERVDYYVTADSTVGGSFSRPGLAPSEVYTTYGAIGLTTVFEDDFETDKGWTTLASPGTTAGFWERGTPVDNRYQPPISDPDSPGTQCYVTEIGTGGNDDVDSGRVGLVSPVMDFSGADGLISYSRWYFNNDADSAESEPLSVEVSGDGGTTWVVAEAVTLEAGGWKRGTFRVSDFVTPSSQVQVRFVARDEPNNSTVEAGVDTFVAEAFDCSLPTATATVRNGSGINPLCYANLTLPILGQSWDAEVDHSTVPGATLTQIHMYAAPSTGPVLGVGEVLVNLGSPKFFVDSNAVTASPNLHQNFIPNDVSFAGIFVATQAVIIGPTIDVCNAVDLLVGI